MKEIFSHIAAKKTEFSKQAFFEFLRDESISAHERLSFAPFVSYFVMGFADINRFVLREEPTSDKLQKIVNTHTYEDDHHWAWFLEDLKRLELDSSMKLSSTLKFLWSEDTYAARKLVSEIYRHASKAPPKMKFVVIEVLEATGNVMFGIISTMNQKLQEANQQDYVFFGRHHLDVENGHIIGMEDSEDFIKNLSLSAEESERAMSIVDDLFAAFTDFVIMAHSHVKTAGQKPVLPREAAPEARPV